MQGEQHLLHAHGIVRRQGLRNREQWLRQDPELWVLSGHFGVSLGNVVLPTQDVRHGGLRLQWQQWLRRVAHVPALYRSAVRDDWPSTGLEICAIAAFNQPSQPASPTSFR
jgi:hypothetical protein